MANQYRHLSFFFPSPLLTLVLSLPCQQKPHWMTLSNCPMIDSTRELSHLNNSCRNGLHSPPSDRLDHSGKYPKTVKKCFPPSPLPLLPKVYSSKYTTIRRRHACVSTTFAVVVATQHTRTTVQHRVFQKHIQLVLMVSLSRVDTPMEDGCPLGGVSQQLFTMCSLCPLLCQSLFIRPHSVTQLQCICMNVLPFSPPCFVGWGDGTQRHAKPRMHHHVTMRKKP